MNRIDDEEEVRRSTRRRHLRREEADERGDIYEEDHPEDELERLLEEMERDREKLNLDMLALRLLLRRHLDLEARWRQFTGVGGITASDFRQYLAGQWRPRVTRQRRHLRLVVNHRLTPRMTHNGGPEAA